MSWTILLVLTSCYSLLGEGASWSWNDFWLNVGKTGQEKGGDDYVDWLGDSFTSSFSSSSNSWYWSTTPTEYPETTEPAGTSTSYKDPSSSPPTSPTTSTITSRSPTASSPSTDWDTPPIDDTKTYKMEEDEDSEDIEKAVTAYYSDYSGWWDWDDYLVTRPPPHPPLPPHPPIPPPTDVEIYEQELVDIVCMFLSTFGDICDPQSQQNPKPLTELSDPYYDPFYDSYYDPWLYDPYYSYDPYYYPHTDSMDDTGTYSTDTWWSPRLYKRDTDTADENPKKVAERNLMQKKRDVAGQNSRGKRGTLRSKIGNKRRDIIEDGGKKSGHQRPPQQFIDKMKKVLEIRKKLAETEIVQRETGETGGEETEKKEEEGEETEGKNEDLKRRRKRRSVKKGRWLRGYRQPGGIGTRGKRSAKEEFVRGNRNHHV